MKQNNQSVNVPSMSLGTRGLFLGLLLMLFPLMATQASGRGGPGQSFMGGEDGGSLPAVAGAPTGLRLFGSMYELQRVVTQISGVGQLHVISVSPGNPAAPLVVTLEGNLRLDLDREVLAEGRVGIFFETADSFGKGLLAITVANRMGPPSAVGASTSLLLPMAAIYGTANAAPPEIALAAYSPSLGFFEARAMADGERVILSQRTVDLFRYLSQ